MGKRGVWGHVAIEQATTSIFGSVWDGITVDKSLNETNDTSEMYSSIKFSKYMDFAYPLHGSLTIVSFIMVILVVIYLSTFVIVLQPRPTQPIA